MYKTECKNESVLKNLQGLTSIEDGEETFITISIVGGTFLHSFADKPPENHSLWRLSLHEISTGLGWLSCCVFAGCFLDDNPI